MWDGGDSGVGDERQASRDEVDEREGVGEGNRLDGVVSTEDKRVRNGVDAGEEARLAMFSYYELERKHYNPGVGAEALPSSKRHTWQWRGGI